MFLINATSVDDAITTAMESFKSPGMVTERPSRNGRMLELNEPVTTKFLFPANRVCFNPVRKANPFLHFFESMWMLAGRNDVAFVGSLAKQMFEYSDDGKTLNGAYGYRWREYWHEDQIETAIDEFKKDPDSRRVVISMWDPVEDFPTWSKDHPCNTHIYFKIRDGKLNMTVCNRSNDAVWGAYGANVVHFSFLQEYMAGRLGLRIGVYHQVSDSLHVYPDVPVVQKLLVAHPWWVDMYQSLETSPAICEDDDETFWFDIDLENFFELVDVGRSLLDASWKSRFAATVLVPMWEMWKAHKNGDIETLGAYSSRCDAEDWTAAVLNWCVDMYEKRVGPYAD